MSRSKDNPPSNLANATRLTDEIYWMPSPDADTLNPTVWHWCPSFATEDEPGGRWVATGTRNHDLISLDPLHLEPSLLWHCCGKHGFIRNDEWIEA